MTDLHVLWTDEKRCIVLRNVKLCNDCFFRNFQQKILKSKETMPYRGGYRPRGGNCQQAALSMLSQIQNDIRLLYEPVHKFIRTGYLYKQNHAFDAWFQKGFTIEQKNSFCYTWNAVCQLQSKKEKEDIHEHE